MNRDAVLATIIGFAIGLTITGVFLIGPNLKSYLPSFLSLPSMSSNANEQNSPLATNTTTNVTEITIESPLSEAVLDTESLLVSGTAPIGSTLVVQGDLDEAVVVVGDDSKYAGKLTLKEGKNDITVTGYDKEGKVLSKAVTVFFTDVEI